MPARSPGIAAANAQESYPAALKNTVSLYRFITVLRTSWRKPTGGWGNLRNSPLVKPD